MTLAAEARRLQIVQLVNAEGWAGVADLANRFGVSEVSVRRDLLELAGQGLVRRVRGGALPVAASFQDDVYSHRAASHVEQKRRIAKAAAALIEANDRIILDSGSTVAELARLIPSVVPLGEQLRIVTGSCPVVEALTPFPQIEVLVLGGIYLHQYRTVIGPQTLASLQGLHADKMFMGSDGLSLQTGTTTANVLEGEVTRLLSQVADKVIVVADSSKIGQTGFTTVMPLKDIDILITDRDAPAEFVADLRKLDVQVRLV
jgi:DeoR/GlpR family transcriptional regulator of sugar metabolism